MITILKDLDEVLKRPEAALARPPLRLLTGAIACYVIYATAAGLFQGGSSVGLAVLKVPLIIVGSVFLCIPSLYVFTALAGGEFSGRVFTSAVAGFCGLAGVLLVGMMPVIWLFSVSSRSLMFVVWLHVFTWITALIMARRVLAGLAAGTRGVRGLWIVLLFLVSLQMTTYLRPVLWREPNEPLFSRQKKSFVTHLYDVGRWHAAREQASSATPQPPGASAGPSPPR